MRKLPYIEEIKTKIPLCGYGYAIIGMPVWVESPCVIGKALLNQYKNKLPDNVYFVIPHQGANDYDASINKLDRYLKVPHKGHLSICTKQGGNSDELADFAEIVISGFGKMARIRKQKNQEL